MRSRYRPNVLELWLGVLALVLLATRCYVESDLTWREKRYEREIREDVEAADRFVDIGVILKVVVADKNGEELIPGKPKLRVIRTHGPFGGMLDTRSNPPQLVGGTREPVTWLCSEDQEKCLLHDDPKVLGQVIKGSEGSGKTRLLAMLHYFWWLELLGFGEESGQTAPTKKRMKMVLEAMEDLYPSSWYTYQKNEQLLTFCDGHKVQFISTKRQSAAQGSPGQGYNWSRGGRDELQDQVDAHNDIESRGRSARYARFKQAATCTAKESADFRTLVNRLISSGKWVERVLLIKNSPFIDEEFLEIKRLVMTDREFRRRYLCEDLPPENMVYFNWSREKNLRAIPPNAKKITSIILSSKTRNPRHHVLVGHDPGISKAGSVWLEAYRLPGIADPCWWVRGELFTTNMTTEQHARAVLKVSRTKFGCNLPRREELVHVRAHPYGEAEDKPDLSVYRIFQRVGLDILAAQYKTDAKGRVAKGTGLIKKDSRIEMVNSLFCDAAGRRRLFVEADEKGDPVTPRLVQGFESMERDLEGKAEHEKKTPELDLSDLPAGLGYGLWPWEKEAAATRRAMERSAA